VTDCIVVGAGPAGLAASVALGERGIEHLVLERDRVAASWRAQRWDSFRLNTAGWMNSMLGGQARDAYATGREVVQRLEQLAAGRPVREGVRVAGLAPRGDRWAVASDDGELLARAVVVATGDQNQPRVGSSSSTPPTTAGPGSSPTERCWWWAAPSPAARSPRTCSPAAAG
jgi:putative flavoprotein involved in K+ transport